MGRPKSNKANAKSPRNQNTKTGRVTKKTAEKVVKKQRGRPKGSKNKKTLERERLEAFGKKESVKQLEQEILDEKQTPASNDNARDIIEQIMFKIPVVESPLQGTPKEVQRELDNLAKHLQKCPEDIESFNRILVYMHGYLVNVVLKKFPFIIGLQTVDIYQETLIALRFKAIPNFKKRKGMSFLNFAKMCIRRHLITLLHASRNRIKDRTINQAISLDSSPLPDDTSGTNTYSNIISDDKDTHDVQMEKSEAYEKTKGALMNHLSEFEKVVLEEYLLSSSYKEIAKDVSKAEQRRYNTKSIDNALLRIRKKAAYLLDHGKSEDIPLFMER